MLKSHVCDGELVVRETNWKYSSQATSVYACMEIDVES